MRWPNPRDVSWQHYDLSLIIFYNHKWYGPTLLWALKRLNPDHWWHIGGGPVRWAQRRWKWLRLVKWPKSKSLQIKELSHLLSTYKSRIDYLEEKLKRKV